MAVPFEMDGAAAAWQREGVDMTQEKFKTMMDELNAAEIERLGVGSREFQERHQVMQNHHVKIRKNNGFI
ncbi:hypothetical protein D3Z62_24120 [Lachnospiraceae bacterium]|nr:hypothetical protein [Lachnospiraceae bacterium]